MNETGCWNTIGVAGDMSCGKLADKVHCRNCEVYSGAAQRNLQRPVDPSYRAEWAARLRQPLPAPEATDSSALAFRIGREWLALPSSMVARVAPQATPHRLPHRSGATLLGVVNVGGTLAPAVSLASMLGIDERDAAAQAGRHTFARLLVVQWEGHSFALPVADLHGIVRFASDALTPPAATINRGMVPYLRGVLARGGMHLGVLDAPLIGNQMTRLLR
ncbi:chemotaxis protein CheW [Massilia cavernae]|uniref:Chemotaxis protein CheW n=1 Tax=Massilia cavernae TaxID=2320864 RepID=A0A418X7M4_9BURK|nr:chemotaxis protein CheW [Massilia cavernae]RJG08505.1 chemotaxis protein CheW [Massilia cavernae]